MKRAALVALLLAVSSLAHAKELGLSDQRAWEKDCRPFAPATTNRTRTSFAVTNASRSFLPMAVPFPKGQSFADGLALSEP